MFVIENGYYFVITNLHAILFVKSIRLLYKWEKMVVEFCAPSIIMKTYHHLYSGIQSFYVIILPVHFNRCFGNNYTSDVGSNPA